MKEVAVQACGIRWDEWYYFCKKLLQQQRKKAFPNGKASNSGKDEAVVDVKECHFRIPRQQT